MRRSKSCKVGAVERGNDNDTGQGHRAKVLRQEQAEGGRDRRPNGM